MTIKEAIDILSPSCRVRTETLKIIRREGMNQGLRYLLQYTIIDETKQLLINKLLESNSNDWNKEL